MFRVTETGLHLSHPHPEVETTPVKTGAFYIVFNKLSSQSPISNLLINRRINRPKIKIRRTDSQHLKSLERRSIPAIQISSKTY